MIFFGRILGKKIDLPHFGEYEIEEFRKHMKLAGFVRSFLRRFTFNEPLLQMKVGQFLKTVGPEGTILFKGF